MSALTAGNCSQISNASRAEWGGNDVELGGFQHQLARRERLFGFGFGHQKGRSGHGFLPVEAVVLSGCTESLQSGHCAALDPNGMLWHLQEMRVKDAARSGVTLLALAPHAQRVCHPVDVVEPGGDQRDLQDSLVIEARLPQALVVGAAHLRGILSEPHHIIQHDALLRRDGRARVVLLEGFYQLSVQRYSTQKLCVRVNSIHAPVGDRYHSGDHFVLATGEG